MIWPLHQAGNRIGMRKVL